jgi:hypothetical protein
VRGQPKKDVRQICIIQFENRVSKPVETLFGLLFLVVF